MTVPSNLIPTRITQLQDVPVISRDSLLLIAYNGVTYKVRAGDLFILTGAYWDNIQDTPTTLAGYGITDAAGNGANSDITSLTGLTTPLSVVQGGTGVATSTGSGSNVLSNSPTLVSPTLGAASATSLVTGALTATGNTSLGDAEANDTHVVKGVTTVLANSASAALTVTQTGAGNAFVVEDSATPDATPFVIGANGNVSITSSGESSSLSITDAGANGANIRLTGDGATTPTKTIRVTGGSLEVINSAYSAVVVSIGDNGNAAFMSATAIPAGGTAGAGVKVSSAANFGVFFGSGAPTVSAAKGSLYLRSDGTGTNDRVYVNTDGTTAWRSLITGETDTFTGLTKFQANVVLPKTTTTGLQVDTTTPTWGWRDITTQITVRGTGAADPTFATYGATILRQYSFSATVEQEVFLVFHIPHDYVPGTDIFLHAHWSNAAAVPNTGNVVWGFDYSFAKGFNQAAFPATTTITVTQASPATRYQHNIAETVAITIPTLEVDGLILVRCYRAAAAVGDTCTDAVFLHTADIHYQSTNMATKAKAPDFYT